MSNTEYRGEIIRKHKAGGRVYEVSYIDYRGLEPIERRKLDFQAFCGPVIHHKVATARLDLLRNGWG